ncbi:MAG: bis(5'-nucleosyl)-tetraphosphatase (symmetrical) YqeK, partial [bacterium]|nr:bis(5'-nucleosyl)-tetraphosphatase (symmetrical) YqeK [bacterium]
MEDNVRELCAYLKKTLKPNRYEHTIGVAYTAANMAMRYGVDIKRAFLAGVLHDNAKNVSDDELLEFCEKNNIEVRDIERTSKYLLHAKVGAYQVKHLFHIEDPEIASA